MPNTRLTRGIGQIRTQVQRLATQAASILKRLDEVEKLAVAEAAPVVVRKPGRPTLVRTVTKATAPTATTTAAKPARMRARKAALAQPPSLSERIYRMVPPKGAATMTKIAGNAWFKANPTRPNHIAATLSRLVRAGRLRTDGATPPAYSRVEAATEAA